MKQLFISLKDNKIYLEESDTCEIIYDDIEYIDIVENIEKYPYFQRIYSEYHITDYAIIKNEFLPLFHFIVLNNLANYIMDKVLNSDYEIYFEKNRNLTKEQTIKLSGILRIEEVYNNLFNILLNYNSGMKSKIKYKNKNKTEKKILKSNKIEEIFYYSSQEKENLKKRVLKDLTEFQYLEIEKYKEEKHYNLPVYIDYEALEKKGIFGIENYMKNWESIAYLKMIIQIHDYFSEYYHLDLKKGLHNDILTTILFEIFNTEIKPIPKSLKRSVEVGKSTSGKCYFIDKIETPVAIPVDIALILRGKDVFSVVVRVSKL
ncbi:hypothetical protein EGX98_04600 [Fusobacterium necrophorum]|uniref:Uncharacterized protein n=3 Tax=Fusobacterium necrophorum TaxID=859 RepID=A0AB73BW15_9FUSO|nr:hypothetical protein [Fusobacterium necrophorum]AYZ73383.1 hypothetical protein EGX98_04600 [Fusobacterium necrophorum]AZW08620.1 hypothetical protein EO219_02820 [Fusobacterium necrophorum subsp. necrophorum]KDE63040.1 hypothetical protein FUSO3_06290 [Fusobacterium necrophorum BL]KDE65229.1 hypothetical protein FUSO5_05035 [Fusobacterium necrophorum BFTR-1]KDE67513.1 hypothetical protein FUSO4_02975 [Fusobacterium necrophorum DJ-1]